MVGPMVQWSNGPMVQWSNDRTNGPRAGPMVRLSVQLSNGRSNSPSNGPMVDPMVQWSFQWSVQWSNGWYNGSMVGPMLQCCNGRSNARSNGPMVGPMAQWSVQWSKVCPMVQRLVQWSVQWSTGRSNGPTVHRPHTCALTCQPPQGGVTYMGNSGKCRQNYHFYIRLCTYVVMSACAPARARARALCFLLKKGDDFASWFSDKVGTFVIVPP